ncbi:MAG: hypothetical protein ABFR95_08350 [Actinomycetota bacterium]
MRKKTFALLTALMMLATLPAVAAEADQGEATAVSTEPLIQHFDMDGNLDGSIVGWTTLVRRSDNLTAVAHATDLKPGGVYSFWWVVLPPGGAAPDDAFAASGGSAIVGESGGATLVMQAQTGDESIEGFPPPALAFLGDLEPLDFDLATAEVHVEIAYHGQAVDAGDQLDAWRADFWTGTACPEAFGLNPGGIPGDFNPIGQPHCPTYITSIHHG